MREVHVAVVRNEIAVWPIDLFPWPRNLTCGGSQQPVVEGFDTGDRAFLVVVLEVPILKRSATDRP